MLQKLQPLLAMVNPSHIKTIKEIRENIISTPKRDVFRNKHNDYPLLKTKFNLTSHTELFASLL